MPYNKHCFILPEMFTIYFFWSIIQCIFSSESRLCTVLLATEQVSDKQMIDTGTASRNWVTEETSLLHVVTQWMPAI